MLPVCNTSDFETFKYDQFWRFRSMKIVTPWMRIACHTKLGTTLKHQTSYVLSKFKSCTHDNLLIINSKICLVWNPFNSITLALHRHIIPFWNQDDSPRREKYKYTSVDFRECRVHSVIPELKICPSCSACTKGPFRLELEVLLALHRS